METNEDDDSGRGTWSMIDEILLQRVNAIIRQRVYRKRRLQEV